MRVNELVAYLLGCRNELYVTGPRDRGDSERKERLDDV